MDFTDPRLLVIQINDFMRKIEYWKTCPLEEDEKEAAGKQFFIDLFFGALKILSTIHAADMALETDDRQVHVSKKKLERLSSYTEVARDLWARASGDDNTTNFDLKVMNELILQYIAIIIELSAARNPEFVSPDWDEEVARREAGPWADFGNPSTN